MEKHTVVITQQHLEKGIEACKDGPIPDHTSYCVFAQACRDVFPGKELYTGISFIEVENQKWDVNYEDRAATRYLTWAFDERHYEDCASLLPLTIQLIRQES